MLSDADTATWILPETVAPVGLVIDTVGGWVSSAKEDGDHKSWHAISKNVSIWRRLFMVLGTVYYLLMGNYPQ